MYLDILIVLWIISGFRDNMSRSRDSQIVTPWSRDPEMIISRSLHVISRSWDNYLEILTSYLEIPTSDLEIPTPYLEIPTSYTEIWSHTEIKSLEKIVGCPNFQPPYLGQVIDAIKEVNFKETILMVWSRDIMWKKCWQNLLSIRFIVSEKIVLMEGQSRCVRGMTVALQA